MCVGCYNSANSNLLLTFACGNCLNITQSTALNTPNIYNGVYWYFTSGYSFGFSDTPTINQFLLDISGLSDAKKLSLSTDIFIGVMRCGTTAAADNTYYKIILKV